jgi:hypothetical protein
MRRKMKAVINLNEAVCPSCHKRLCRILKGGHADGIEIWCKTCREPVLLEIGTKAAGR